MHENRQEGQDMATGSNHSDGCLSQEVAYKLSARATIDSEERARRGLRGEIARDESDAWDGSHQAKGDHRLCPLGLHDPV